MKLKEDYGSGFAGRPDDSGIRGKGLVRKPLVRPKDFPYDRPITYGQPMAYDRGSSGAGPSHNGITPMDTSHSAWDDLEEITGSPILLTKAYQGSQLGNSTGVPGAAGGWATNPKKDWDDSEVSDCKLDIFGEGGFFDVQRYTLDPQVPEPEGPPNPESPYFHDKTDDELEKKIDRIFRRGDEYLGDPEEKKGQNDIYVFGVDHPFTALGNSFRSSRALGGLMPKESAWDFLRGK